MGRGVHWPLVKPLILYMSILVGLLTEMTNRVYIGRLSPAARERDVERFFKPYGRIRDINLKNGFGFVEFDSVRDADEAVYSCDGKELMGERVLVELAKGGSSYGRRASPPMNMGSSSSSSSFRSGYRGYYYSRGYAKYGPPVRTEYRVVVENLSSRVSWQDLKDFMRVAGRISYADAHRKRVGEGIVEFMSYDDMKTALRKLDGQELHGRTIRLFDGRSRHSPKRSRSRGRSRSHSHSRGRRHSRSYSHSSSSPSPSRVRDRYRERERDRDRSRDRDRRRRSPSHSSQEERKKRRRDSHSNESKSESRSPTPIKKSPANDKYSIKSEAESPEHERSPSESPAKEQSGGEDMLD